MHFFSPAVMAPIQAFPLLGFACVVFASSVAVAAEGQLNPGKFNMEERVAVCAQGSSGDDLSQIGATFADCMLDEAVRIGAGAAFGLMDAKGKRVFGPGFAVTSRLHYAMRSRDKVLGDLDLVLPLGSAAQRNEASPPRAWFVQHGITRWTDAQGEVRHDTRFGGVHRFTVGIGQGGLDGRDGRGGIYGVSMLLQQNREYGHERMVAGLDYVGAWGGGSLNWYRPLTQWLPGRAGYEERALEGHDLALNFNLTTTVDMRATLGRWEQTADPDEVHTQASLGLDWQPHDYLTLGANLSDIGSNSGSDTSWRAKLEVPLGGVKKAKPRWHGFGLAAVANPQGANIWRGLTHATRIQYAERKVQTAPAGQAVDGVTVRFLQAEAVSGTDIRIEVSLPAPAAADTPLVIRLQPGDGDNSAEPGVDFVDEPVAIIIRAGDTSAIATVRLLTNFGMTGECSLGVTVRAGANGSAS